MCYPKDSANFRKTVEARRGGLQHRSGSVRRSPQRRDHFGSDWRHHQRSGRGVSRWCGLCFRIDYARASRVHSRSGFGLANPRFRQIKTRTVSNSDTQGRQYLRPLVVVPCSCVLVNRAHEAPPRSRARACGASWMRENICHASDRLANDASSQ